jgi:hypothetical protein
MNIEIELETHKFVFFNKIVAQAYNVGIGYCLHHWRSLGFLVWFNKMEEMNNSLMMDLLSDNARLGVDDLHFVSSLGIVFFLSIVFVTYFCLWWHHPMYGGRTKDPSCIR